MYNSKLKGNMMLLLTALIWGISFISQSKGVETIDPVAFNGIRSILGGVVLLPVIYFLDRKKVKNGKSVKKPDKTLLLGGLACGVFLCLGSTLQSVGMVETSPGKAGFITALYMIIVPVAGLFLGKKPNLQVVGSVIIATIGMYFMCIEPGALSFTHGDLLVFICAFAFTGHILVIDYFSPKADGVKLSCMQFFVCGIIDLAIAAFGRMPSVEAVSNCLLAIGYSGIMSCGVAYTLQIVGQKYTDPTSASILMSLESVFATLATVVLTACGFELTGGVMTMREILGCILMFTAIILVQLPQKKMK